MNPDLEVLLTVTLPRGGKRFAAGVTLDDRIFQDSFAPLPRLRELPFALREQDQAARQQAMRRDVARALAEQLATKILELIEAEDPQHGYSPQEWRQINET